MNARLTFTMLSLVSMMSFYCNLIFPNGLLYPYADFLCGHEVEYKSRWIVYPIEINKDLCSLRCYDI